jgi:uncharacterized delta-60 repeat protein
MKNILTTLLLAFFLQSISAQPGTIDHTFNPGDVGFGLGDGADRFDKVIHSTVKQPDGKLLIAGDFRTFNGLPYAKIARLNSDGTLDTSFVTGSGFDPDFSASVSAIALQDDGKILVGGSFENYNGHDVVNLVRLNQDGSIDLDYDQGLGFSTMTNQMVLALKIQPDGKILVGGIFTTFNDVEVEHFIRLHPDGSLDTTFNAPSLYFTRVIEIQPDNKILVGGSFRNAGGTENHRLVRLMPDGSVDSTFNVGFGGDPIYPGFTDPVILSIIVQPDNKLLVSGRFSTYFGEPAFHIIRLHEDGSLDTSFNHLAAHDDAHVFIFSIVPVSDGKYLVGGQFSEYDNVEANGMVRIFHDGSIDSTFNCNLSGSTSVHSILVLSDDKIIISGRFEYFHNIRFDTHLVRLKENGEIDPDFNRGTGASREVQKIHIMPDGKIIIAGPFTHYNGEVLNRIARLNADGTADLSFEPGTGFNTFFMTALASYADDKILVSGIFPSYNNFPSPRFVRINADGSPDESFNTGAGPHGFVYDIEVLNDGKILIGGTFSDFNGLACPGIVRLNPDASVDNTFLNGSQASGVIFTMSVQEDEKVVIGGTITSFTGTPIKYLARLNTNGTLDNTFSYTYGPDDRIRGSSLYPGGRIMIHGDFSMYDSILVAGIARLHQDGSLDTTFNPGFGANDLVESMAIQPDGKIILAGNFTLFDSIAANRIVRLNEDGSVDATFVTGTGANGRIRDVAIHEHERIIIAGDFTAYDGTGRNRIARIMGDQPDGVRNNFKTASIKIYPNPAQDFVHIEADRYLHGASIHLYDLQGRVVDEQINANGQMFQLRIGKHKPGIYIVEIRHDEFVGRQKVIRY